MAVRDINDLYQQLSADENFTSLFTNEEDFAETMQSMSSDRQQAFYDKIVSGTQISNVDFSKALKKKKEEGFTFESLSVGSNPSEPVEKIDVKVPELAVPDALPVLPVVEGPVDPKTKVKSRIVEITNGLNTDPGGEWIKQYQDLLNDPDYKKVQFASDVQSEFKNIYSSWSNLSKDNYQLKQAGEQLGFITKTNLPPVAPAPKSVAFKTPTSLYGRAYADAVAAEKRKSDPLGQQTKPLYIAPSKRTVLLRDGEVTESDNNVVVQIEAEKLIEADKYTEAEIKKVKTTPGTLYNAIGSKKLKYFTSQGQEFPVDEYALGAMLFNSSSIEVQDASGPVDITNLDSKDRTGAISVLNEDTFKKVLLNNGFPKNKLDEEIERLKNQYRERQASSEMDQKKNRHLNESGGNQSIANVKFLGEYNEKGRELLSDDEQEAYALVLRLEGMYRTLRANTNLSAQGYVNGVKVSDFVNTIRSTQEKLTALRDNPNNLYDWETGEFIDTRIVANKPKVTKIQQQNKQFEIEYAKTPKGDLTRMRNTLIAQRDVVVRKMQEDGMQLPEADTFGSFVAKLQTSAARSSGNYTITLPNGLTMNSVQYEKKIKEYQGQLFEVEKNLYGINRALMLNENVLLRDEAAGFIESTLSNLGTGISSIGRQFIPGSGGADAKADWEVRNSLLMLGQNGYVISPELKSLARKTVGEQIFDSAGMLVDAMAQIAIGNIAVPEIIAMKWAKSFSSSMATRYGRAGEMVFANTAGAIRQGTIFQVAGQGFATGVGESLGQVAFDALKLERLFVNKGRVLPFLTRSILGGVGETISEYAGQYLDVVAENGIAARDNFKKTFGHDIESQLDQLLVIGITSVSFSGAANLKLLTATASALENILENPQSAAAFGDILDAEKKQEIEEVLKIVNSKINDRQSQKTDKGIVDEKTIGVDAPIDAVTRSEEVSFVEERRKEDLQNLYDRVTPTTDAEKEEVNLQVDEINKKYDNQLDALLPKSTKFDSLTGVNLSAVVAGADMNAPHVIDFLANIPQERNRRAAAELIAITQKANATLRSIMPDAVIILHDRNSFKEKMKSRGLADNRRANITFEENTDGTPRVEIQINAENGSFEDIAHEVTHAILFDKFFDNENRLKEISELKNSITASPEELNTKIEEVNKKYNEKFSEVLGEFRDGLKKVATTAQSKELDDFVASYSEDQRAEEWIVEFTAWLAKSGERLVREQPSLFDKILNLVNKLVSKIGIKAGIKLQEFTDTQELVDFMNNISTAIRQGKGVENITTKTNKDAVQEQATGQVPVQSEATVGEEVVEGVTQAEPQEVTEKGRKEKVGRVENLPVYFGGAPNILSNLRPGSIIYVTQNKAEAQRYADQSPSGEEANVVNELAITGNIATEEQARAIMDELNLTPETEGYSRDELMLMELLDPNMGESALSASDIKKFNEALQAKGFDGMEFVDNGLQNKEITNIYIVNPQVLNTLEAPIVNEEAVERTPIGLKEQEETAVYDIIDDTNGNLYEQENLNITGSNSQPLAPSGRLVDKARIDYTKDFVVDGIEMRAVKYIDSITTRNKKYNATMSDHTKVGSYKNNRTKITVPNLYGGFLFSYIAENFDNGVVWGSTGIKQARELVMNSVKQDMTLIYRMNRATGSNGNDNFAQIAVKELLAPMENGLISEEEMLTLLNERMSSVKEGQIVLGQGYATGVEIGKVKIYATDKKTKVKSVVEYTLKEFASIKEFENAFLGGGAKQKLSFATRGLLWKNLLNSNSDTEASKGYYKKIEQLGVPRIPEIVDLLAEPVTDEARDSDIIAALKINAPEMVSITEKGKTISVPKIYTPFTELVDEENGVFFKQGVRHTSYPYVVLGSPLGAFNEFHSVKDYFPIINDWMTKIREGNKFLTEQEFLNKNADAIRAAYYQREEALTNLNAIIDDKSVPKEIKKELQKQFDNYDTAYKKSKRFTPRLTSPYKAIETMHKELMSNFDSTVKLQSTGKSPLRQDKARIEPWSTPQQEITSAGTSINKAKLPGVYSDKSFFNILRAVPGNKITIVDVGSGKYANQNIKPLLEKGIVSDLITEGSQIKLNATAVPTIQEIIEHKEIVYLPYDPFNQPANVNENTIDQVKGGRADIGISPNVLNVIAEADAREGVIANLADAVGDTGTAIIQIYEGDPKDKGNGKITKTGGEQSWQNNQPTSWYIPEVKKYFANVKFSNKIIIADNKVFGDKARLEGKALEAKQYGIPQRYKGDVGKFIGGDLYVHKSAMNTLPTKELEIAESKLPEDFEYEIVKYNASSGSFSFIDSPDWNSAKEPVVGDSYKVSRTGEVTITRQKSDPQIYHHKWIFVRDDYDGFNVNQSIQRSIDWYRDAKEDINMFRIGTKSYWNTNAEPLIKNTNLTLQDKARLQDNIQNDYAKFKSKNPLAVSTDIGNHLLKKGYSLGEIKRFIPELEAYYKTEAIKRFKASITKTQGKLKKRQDSIREKLAQNPSLSYTSMYEQLKNGFEDFELYKAFYEEGASPSELDDLFGTDYRQTIQKIITETEDGKTVYSPDLLREIRESAKARKMVDIADQMKNVFAELGDVVNAETIINAAADSLEEGFIEAAMQEVTDDMRRRRQEMKESADTLIKISKGDIKSDTIIDVSRLLSFAGRILQAGRGLTESQEGLEKLIFNSLEVVEYRPGRNVVRKQRVFKLLPEQKEKIRKAIKTFKTSKEAFNKATKELEDGPDMYTDQVFDAFDKAKAQFEKDSRLLKMTISAFKRVGFGNWFTSMTALGLLSFRTLTIGIVGNVEMMLASNPRSSVFGKILGFSRILADKLVKNLTQVGGKDINEQIARGSGVSVDSSIYRKMAFEQGKQQIINIFENTVSDAGGDNNVFIDNKAIIDSNQELKKSFKMMGKLLMNLLPKDKEATKKEWAIAFDKLLVLMNEKDENGNAKLEQQNPRGYQMASTFLRGIFGSIPTATGKVIALSGDRVFFKYGYYQSLVAYANSQGITDPAQVQRFIRLNSIPGTNADAMARRSGDYRIFQSDNALVRGMANFRKKITEAEKSLDAQSAVLKSQGKKGQTLTRILPRKLVRLASKVFAVLVSPFTRIPSNFIATGVKKTVFPISFAVYLQKQLAVREKVKTYEDLFGLDKNPTMTKVKLREMEAMRLEIFEMQRDTQIALNDTLQALQVLGFGTLLLLSGAASAPYGEDEDEKARARAAGIAQQPSGSINFTHFFEWASGQANRYRVTKKGDVIMSYTNLGIIGFGLSEVMSLASGIAGKEYEGKKVMGLGEDGYSNFSFDLVFESLGNGVTNLSFIQNVVALGNAIRGQGNAVENLAVNLTKTIMTVPMMSFGVFGAIERAEGITLDAMRNYMPELEPQDNTALSRFQARVITSLTGKSPVTWFGLKDEMGNFKSPYASPYYRAQIGPHGEELYKKNTFWDLRGGDFLGAYLQASFDPFSFHDYEGFVSQVKKFKLGDQYKKGDVVQGPSGVYAVLKDNKNLDFKNANKNPDDPEFQFLDETTDFFDRDRFMANQRGTEYSQALFDIMNIYQQVTGDNKPFKVMSTLYEPLIKGKDAEGDFSIYVPQKYFRELAMARGEAARTAYDLDGMKATLERIYRAEEEGLFETDEEYKNFVRATVEDVLLGPADTEYNRDGGVGGLIKSAVMALEDSETYRKIKRNAVLEGLKNEIFTEEEYLRLARSDDFGSLVNGIPDSELKFRK